MCVCVCVLGVHACVVHTIYIHICVCVTLTDLLLLQYVFFGFVLWWLWLRHSSCVDGPPMVVAALWVVVEERP